MRYLQIYGRVKSLSCSTISYIYQKYIYLLLYFQSEIIYGMFFFFFFQAEDGIRDIGVTGVQTCALPIYLQEDIGAMARSMDAFAPGKGHGEGYRRFQDVSRTLHDVSERFFFWKPVEDLFDTLDFRANMNPDTLRDVMALRMGRTMAKVIRGHVPDARLAQMLDHYCQYVGSSPYLAPAVPCSIEIGRAHG